LLRPLWPTERTTERPPAEAEGALQNCNLSCVAGLPPPVIASLRDRTIRQQRANTALVIAHRATVERRVIFEDRRHVIEPATERAAPRLALVAEPLTINLIAGGRINRRCGRRQRDHSRGKYNIEHSTFHSLARDLLSDPERD
jgi:hypothetical protein